MPFRASFVAILFTTGTKEGVQYTDYLDPARTAAKEAIDNYAAGKVEPLAELLRNGIRMTNREAANLSDLNSEHAMNTLYLIGRMWNTVQKNEALRDAEPPGESRGRELTLNGATDPLFLRKKFRRQRQMSRCTLP